jgi:hypothetical protein
MRRLLPLLLLPVFITPVFADVPDQTSAPAHHTRMKWEDRFTRANLAHDGHLTFNEAKAGYPSIARHFRDIDADAKGYITQEDVRAWHALQRASHQRGKQPDDPLSPRNAFHQRLVSRQHAMTASAIQTVAMPEAPTHKAEPRN